MNDYQTPLMAEARQGIDESISDASDAPDSRTVALLQAAEVNQQIATAKKYPRSVATFRRKAQGLVTLNEAIAKECVYAIPRDGKMIEGPSARFAEIMISTWGNCRAGARVVDEDARFVTAQGVFHDLESNSAITFEVKRRIVDKRGFTYSPDMIGVTANAACSIALRNAVLKGVPKAFWADIFAVARQTVMGDFKTLENRRTDAIQAFQPYGVKPEQVYAVLAVKGIHDITVEHLVQLNGLLNAIKDDGVVPESIFPDLAPQVASSTGGGPAAATTAPATEPVQAQPPAGAKKPGRKKKEAPPAAEAPKMEPIPAEAAAVKAEKFAAFGEE